jgi:hypothetical protein
VDLGRLVELIGDEATTGIVDGIRAPLALGSGEPPAASAATHNHNSGLVAAAGAAQNPGAEPAASAREASRQKNQLPPVSVSVDFQEFDGQSLGLSNTNEIFIVKILPSLGPEPFSSRAIYDAGFFPDAKNDVTRQSTFSNTMPRVMRKLLKAAGRPVIGRVKDKGAYAYSVLVPMVIDGQQVQVSVKKN